MKRAKRKNPSGRSRKKLLPLDERTLTDALTTRLAKKFASVIDSVEYPGGEGDAWFYLKPGLCWDPESHAIHESIYGHARNALEGVSVCECSHCVMGSVLKKLGLSGRDADDQGEWLGDLIYRSARLDIPEDQIVKLARRTLAADLVTRTLIIGSSDASLRRLAAAT